MKLTIIAIAHHRNGVGGAPFDVVLFKERGRDGSRTPFPWSSDAPGAGFTTDAARSWLPVPASHRPLALDRQQGRPDAPLAVHRAAFAWRRDHPALRHGSVTVLPQDGPVLAFGRAAPGERLLLAFNLSITPAGFAVPAGSAWTSLPVPANAALPAGRHVGTGDRIALPPLGVLMLRQA